MLNPYVEGNVYPFVACFFWLSCCLGLARRAPFGGRRKRGAQPAAPDVIKKNQCDSKLRCWVQQLMHIVHPAIVCKRYIRSLHLKYSKNWSKISEKSSPGQSESIQIRPCSTKSMTNRRESSKSQYLSDFGGAFWRSKRGENHQILMKIQTAFQ